MVTNIWNPLGIRTSPFFQEALDISESSLRPINLFVGRKTESDDVIQRIIGADSNRIVISGLPGSGKTSFIQYIKFLLGDQLSYAVSSEFCRVPHQFSVTALGVELLRSVVRSLRNVLPDNKLEKLEGFESARSLIEETQRRAWQFNISVLGSGVGGGTNRQPRAPAFGPEQFQDALAGLSAAAMAEGIPGIVIHLNNLENLDRDTAEASVLFRDARDYFLVPGLHIILGATSDFYSSVVSTYAQVRSVFTPPIRLDPMDFNDVRELLNRRYDFLKIKDMDITPPVTWNLVEEFHQVFQGDLRGMLIALDDVCYRALALTRPAPLDIDQAIPVLAPMYHQQLADNLTATEFAYLQRLNELGDVEFRQSDVKEHLGISQGRVSTLFSSLDRSQSILKTRSEGRSQYYSLAGRARLAFSRRLS